MKLLSLGLKLLLALVIDAGLAALLLASHTEEALWKSVVVGGFSLAIGLLFVPRWQLVGIGMLFWIAVYGSVVYVYLVTCNCNE